MIAPEYDNGVVAMRALLERIQQRQIEAQQLELFTGSTNLRQPFRRAVFVIALAPLVSDLPSPTLAAIVIVAATAIVRPKDWAALYRFRRFEVTLGLVTLVGVAVLGILPGIVLAVIVNLLELVATLSRPSVVTLGPMEGSTRWRAVSPTLAAVATLLLLFMSGFILVSEVLRRRAAKFVVDSAPHNRTVSSAAVTSVMREASSLSAGFL